MDTHTYGYAYGTDSGATRRPRLPFPKGTGEETNDRADDKVTTYAQKGQVHRSPKLDDGLRSSTTVRTALDNYCKTQDWTQLVHYVGFLPSRYVNPASRIGFTSTHPVSSLVQDWMGCLHPLLKKRRNNSTESLRLHGAHTHTHSCAHTHTPTLPLTLTLTPHFTLTTTPLHRLRTPYT